MKEIRKIEKQIEWYELFVWEYPEFIKQELNESLKEIQNMEDVLNENLERLIDEYERNSEIYSMVYFDSQNIFFKSLKNKIKIVILDIFQWKCQKKLNRTSNLKIKTIRLKERLIQFKYFEK